MMNKEVNMKNYEVVAWSSVTAFDKVFFFEFMALDEKDALAKFSAICDSPEYAQRKLRLESLESTEDRLARIAALGL
jgi:hypothetical protein